ncbi:MAG: MerC domain-containing protein [Gammaproteobacteria bacterium]|nr:MerC domain-containing protein [Gammaproteobacteria bacterium]
MPNRNNPELRYFDGSALLLSLICLAHCLLLPLLITASPLISIFTDAEWLHIGLLTTAIPVSLLGLWLGFRQHRQLAWLLIGIIGLTLMTLAIMYANNESQETYFTVSGVILIAIAHCLNWHSHQHHSSRPTKSLS